MIDEETNSCVDPKDCTRKLILTNLKRWCTYIVMLLRESQCVCVCVWERERDRGKEKERERERGTCIWWWKCRARHMSFSCLFSILLATCKLSPDTGPCRAAFTRYFYNPTSEQCETFTYGGCEGNDNNFESLWECELECSGKSATVRVWNGALSMMIYLEISTCRLCTNMHRWLLQWIPRVKVLLVRIFLLCMTKFFYMFVLY